MNKILVQLYFVAIITNHQGHARRDFSSRLVKPCLKTSSNQSEDESLKTDADRNRMLGSCEGNCDLNQRLPCSCGIECVIHGNCCEDVELFCPGTKAKGKAEYSALVNAQVECHDTGVFMIMSCDPVSVSASKKKGKGSLDLVLKADDTESPLPLDIPGAVREAILAFKSGTVDNIGKILANTPITDVMSTFTFLNFTVLENCGGFAEAQHAAWVPEIYLDSIVSDPNRLNKEAATVWYFPPQTYPVSSSYYSPCAQVVAANCSSNYGSELEELCLNATTSYVQVHTGINLTQCEQLAQGQKSPNGNAATTKVYRNRYCALCSSAETDVLSYVVDWSLFHSFRNNIFFSLSFKFTDDGFDVLAKSDQFVNKEAPWRQASCTFNQDNRMASRNVRCNIDKCNVEMNYEMTGENVCEINHHVALAIVVGAEDGIVEALLDYVASITQCALRKAGYNIRKISETGVTDFEPGAKAIMLVYDAMLKKQTTILISRTNNDKQFQDLNEVTVISKFIHGYLQTVLQCSDTKYFQRILRVREYLNPNLKFISADNTFLGLNDFFLNQSITSKNTGNFTLSCAKLFNKNEPWFRRGFEDKCVNVELPRESIITCLCSGEKMFLGNNLCYPECWQTPPFQNDMTILKNLHLETCLPFGIASTGTGVKATNTWAILEELSLFLGLMAVAGSYN